MQHANIIVILFLLVVGSIRSQLAAQEELEAFIERDSAAFIVIQEPEAILQQIESSVFFQNRHFKKALELMVEGEFPLADDERLNELEEKWYEMRDLLSRFDEVSLIIHSLPDQAEAVPQISVALSGAPEPIESMGNLLTDVKSSIMNEGSGKPDLFSLLAGSLFPGISIQKAGNLILLSNAPEKSEELMTRLEKSADKKFKSLARNRSYLQVQQLLEKRAKSPQVRGFLAPKSFRGLITRLVTGDQVIMVDPPESIASAGFQVVLQSDSEKVDTPDGIYQPVINWDFVLTYTQPASGFGKLIESFEPFSEFPSLPYSITSLSALGFDLKAKHDADKEIFDKYQKHLFAPSNEGEPGGMSFETFFCFTEFGLFGAADEFDLNPMLEAANGSISVYHEGNPIHWKPAMEIRRVNNREAMEELLANKLKSENRTAPKNEQFVEIPNDHGRLFGRTESGIREYLGRQAENWRERGEKLPDGFSPQEGKPISDSIMSKQYEYFINDDWLIHCDHNSMKQFLRAAYEETSDLEAFDLLLEATKSSSGQSSFFKIEYQSNVFYKVENKRMQNSIESNRIKEKYGTGRSDQSPEVWKRLLAEPDEFGLRNEIESTEDAAAAVQQLVVHAFNDTFGTVVSLYSSDDHKMRIFGQIYSLVDE